MRSSIVLLVCLACSAPVVRESVAPASAAQGVVHDDARAAEQDPLARAVALFREGEWERALPLFEQVVASDSANGKAWFQLGYCQHMLGRYEQSLAAWTKAAELTPRQAVLHYDIACANARLGRADAAFAALETALSHGFNDMGTAANDPDLAALRGDARFTPFLRKLAAAASPPPAPPQQASQFDFWLGEWDVYTAAGVLAGQSRIERILGGFVVHENWSGLGGVCGQSFNTFDPRTQRWRQHWVDDHGDVVDFTDGVFDNGTLTFQCSFRDASGVLQRRRLTFTDLGEKGVRQYSEASADEGRTWTAEYDLFYRRRAAGG